MRNFWLSLLVALYCPPDLGTTAHFDGCDMLLVLPNNGIGRWNRRIKRADASIPHFLCHKQMTHLWYGQGVDLQHDDNSDRFIIRVEAPNDIKINSKLAIETPVD